MERVCLVIIVTGSSGGADPYFVVGTFKEVADMVVRQAVGVVGIMAVNLKGMAVEPV